MEPPAVQLHPVPDKGEHQGRKLSRTSVARHVTTVARHVAGPGGAGTAPDAATLMSRGCRESLMVAQGMLRLVLTFSK